MERMRTVAFFLGSLVFTVNALAAEPLSVGAQAASSASTNVFVFGDLSHADPQEVQAILQKLFPTARQGQIVAPENVRSSSTDKAEAINAQAMREFQQGWEIHLRNPRTTLPPILYPSKSQQILLRPRQPQS